MIEAQVDMDLVEGVGFEPTDPPVGFNRAGNRVRTADLLIAISYSMVRQHRLRYLAAGLSTKGIRPRLLKRHPLRHRLGMRIKKVGVSSHQ